MVEYLFFYDYTHLEFLQILGWFGSAFSINDWFSKFCWIGVCKLGSFISLCISWQNKDCCGPDHWNKWVWYVFVEYLFCLRKLNIFLRGSRAVFVKICKSEMLTWPKSLLFLFFTNKIDTRDKEWVTWSSLDSQDLAKLQVIKQIGYLHSTTMFPWRMKIESTSECPDVMKIGQLVV